MAGLIFPASPTKPCTWRPGVHAFYACKDCLTATEVRFCDGTIEPTWDLCSEHQRNCVNFDEEMLDYLRDSVYTGLFSRPPPTHRQVTVPGSFKTRFQIADTRWPKTTYDYKHINGCIHSSEPNVRLSDDLKLRLESLIDSLPSDTTPVARKPTDRAPESVQALTNAGVLRDLQLILSRGFTNRSCEQSISELIQALEFKSGLTLLAEGAFFRRCNGTYYNSLDLAYCEKNEVDESAEAAPKASRSMETSTSQAGMGNVSSEDEAVQGVNDSKDASIEETGYTSPTTPDRDTEIQQPQSPSDLITFDTLPKSSTMKPSPSGSGKQREVNLIVLRPENTTRNRTIPLCVLQAREQLTDNAETNLFTTALTMWTWNSRGKDSPWKYHRHNRIGNVASLTSN